MFGGSPDLGQWPEVYSLKVWAEQGWPLVTVVVNLSCAILGAGTLGLPHALSQTGWSGVSALILLAWMQTYTGHVLLEVMTRYPDCEAYHDLGEAVWGKSGKYMVMLVQAINNVGTAVLYFIVSADHLHILFADFHFTSTVWTFVVLVLVFPLCMLPSMKEFSFASAIGLLASVTTTAVVLWSLHASHSRSLHLTSSPVGLAMTIQAYLNGLSTFSFAFCPHTVLPAAIKDLPEPRMQVGNLGLALSMLLCCMCYLLISIPTYWVYGNNISEDILTNMPHSLGWYVAILGITVHVMIAIPIFANETFFIVERSLRVVYRRPKRDDPDCKLLAPGIKLCEKVVVRSFLLLGIALIAIVCPFFGDMMSFLGGTSMLASCVFPSCFYIYTFRELTLSTRVLNWLIIVASLLMGIGSAFVAAKSMSDRTTHSSG